MIHKFGLRSFVVIFKVGWSTLFVFLFDFDDSILFFSNLEKPKIKIISKLLDAGLVGDANQDIFLNRLIFVLIFAWMNFRAPATKPFKKIRQYFLLIYA